MEETTISFSQANKHQADSASPVLLEKDQVPSWLEEGPESENLIGGHSFPLSEMEIEKRIKGGASLVLD